MATQPVKWFSNGRGMNILPAFYDKLPGRSKFSANDPIVYPGTNSPVGFWRYYDPDAIDVQIKTLREAGVNNIRVWTNFYVYNRYANLPEERNPFYTNLKHLVKTLEKYRMYCLWVFFDGLFLFPGPTEGLEFDDVDNWYYSPTSALMLDPLFIQNSGSPYISSVCKFVSGSQATMAYEIINETAYTGMASANWINSVSSIKMFDKTPNRRIGLGFPLQLPFYNVTGVQANSLAEISNNQLQVHIDSSANLVTIHPYASLDLVRSFYVETALSAAHFLSTYVTGMGIFFSEGAFDNAANSYRDFFDWCETSGLGFSVFQGFSGKEGDVVYPGIGLFHSDGDIRLSSTVNFLTGMAIRAGYSTDRIRLPNYKNDYVDNNGDLKSDFYFAPPNHPLSHSLSVFAKSNPRYVLGGLDKDIDQEIPIDILRNWSTCTIDLSAVRNLYASENDAFTHLLQEQSFQYGAISLLTELKVLTSHHWGLSASPASSYFDRYNLTSIVDYSSINVCSVSADALRVVKCAEEFSGGFFIPGGCLWGPGCPNGEFGGGVGDCWDWTAYTAVYKQLRDFTCQKMAQVGIFTCL